MAYTTINKSTDYFNTKIYTGNGSTNAQTGLGFQPDWVWLKGRSNSGSHKLMDAVRGSSSSLCTNNSNAAEGADYFSSFDSNGFTVNGTSNDINANGQTYVGWNWKANGQGSSNTDGSINTTYTSANTTSGCSIITYTGTGANATIGHGLGKVPTFIIFRRYAQAENWNVYHQSLGAAKSLRLNETGAEANDTTALNSTAPTSSLISLGSSVNTNASGNPMIAWCFSDVQGFSKAGSYTGNGNADGTFVYTGFKPAFIMIKNSSSSSDWAMFDNKRQGYNVANNLLYPNNTTADTTGTFLDLLSNGFKMRTTASWSNASGSTYIYMAFGQPIVSTNGDIATAR